MALTSAGTTVKLFSVIRASPIASLSAGRFVAANSIGQQKRSASEGKNQNEIHNSISMDSKHTSSVYKTKT